MSVGKNFSANNLGQRRASDFYETPYSITQQLLDVVTFDKDLSVCEPACGAGAIVKVLQSNNFTNIIASDIEHNFLDHTQQYHSLITNPPFSLAFEFAMKAKTCVQSKFALLLPLSYLHGQKRYEQLWQDVNFPLKEVHVFTRYPMLGDVLRNDGRYRTGMMVYAWYVWDKQHVGTPSIKWINNNEHVINSRSQREQISA